MCTRTYLLHTSSVVSTLNFICLGTFGPFLERNNCIELHLETLMGRGCKEIMLIITIAKVTEFQNAANSIGDWFIKYIDLQIWNRLSWSRAFTSDRTGRRIVELTTSVIFIYPILKWHLQVLVHKSDDLLSKLDSRMWSLVINLMKIENHRVEWRTKLDYCFMVIDKNLRVRFKSDGPTMHFRFAQEIINQINFTKTEEQMKCTYTSRTFRVKFR